MNFVDCRRDKELQVHLAEREYSPVLIVQLHQYDQENIRIPCKRVLEHSEVHICRHKHTKQFLSRIITLPVALVKYMIFHSHQ